MYSDLYIAGFQLTNGNNYCGPITHHEAIFSIVLKVDKSTDGLQK